MLAKKKKKKINFLYVTLASEFNLRHKLYLLLHSKLSQWWYPCLILHIYSPFPHLCLPATSGHALLCPPLEIAIFFHKLTFLTTGLVLGMGNYFKPSQIESFSWFLELEQEVRVFSSWMGRQEFADSPQSLGRESWFSREEIKANLQKEAKLTKRILIAFEPLVLVSETSPLPKFPSSSAFQKAFVRVSFDFYWKEAKPLSLTIQHFQHPVSLIFFLNSQLRAAFFQMPGSFFPLWFSYSYFLTLNDLLPPLSAVLIQVSLQGPLQDLSPPLKPFLIDLSLLWATVALIYPAFAMLSETYFFLCLVLSGVFCVRGLLVWFITYSFGDSDSKESACNAGVPGLIPGSGRFPGEENGYSLQYSCLENSKDRGA